MSATTINTGQSLADGAGLIASIACAIHCAAMPLVIGYLPMLGLSWLADESFHRVMAGVCFALAIGAFVPGWRKHRSLAPAFVGTAGVTLLAGAAFVLEGECCPSCSPSGGVPVAELGCADERCPLCIAAGSTEVLAAGVLLAEVPAARAPAGGARSEENLMSWATPFITPFGGILLVAGHLVNHRKSCRCTGDSCCVDTIACRTDASVMLELRREGSAQTRGNPGRRP